MSADASLTAADALEHERSVDLAEFDRLRSEIDSRTQLSTQLVVANLTALGAGLSVFDKFPDVVIALAGVSSFLWLLWLDQTAQIFKVAAYISIDLGTRLRRGTPGLLGWEYFMRRLDSGGGEALDALYGPHVPRRGTTFPVMPSRYIVSYVILIFALGPAALLAIAGAHQHSLGFDVHDSTSWIRALSLGGAAVLWAVSAYIYWRFRASRAALDRAVLDVGAWHAGRPREEDAAGG